MKTRSCVVPAAWNLYARLATLLPLFIFLLCPWSFGQNLDDFRSAAAADGIKLIPFRDMQSDANSLASEVQRRKDEVQKFSYDVLASQKDNFLSDNKKMKQEIENVKKDKSDWLSKNPGGNAASFDDEIRKRDSTINSNNSKPSDLNAKLKNGADAFGSLNTARARLRDQFDKVLRELSSAKSSPSKYLGSSFSEDDRKKFENYISVIKDQIESQVTEHKKQEEGAAATKERYERLINKTEI